MGDELDLGKLRYDKIFLLMDADADGHHIATLLLTFFYRHMRKLIDAGHVYIAQPPLYRIDLGKQTFWALDDQHRDQLLKANAKSNSKPSITRFQRPRRDEPRHAEDDDARSEVAPVAARHRQAERAAADRPHDLRADGQGRRARFKMITENAAEIGDLDV